MDIATYIASGILELYVAGQLSEEENREVARMAGEYPEIQAEIEAIEKAILALSKAAKPTNSSVSFAPILTKISGNADSISIRRPQQNRPAWISYTGWAAAVVLGAGSFYLATQQQSLNQQLENTSTRLRVAEQQLDQSQSKLQNYQDVLSKLREPAVQVVPLGGQVVDPSAYARAYWNGEKGEVVLDISGLPPAPEGMAYQVWSLKLSPLTPTSMGVLETNDEGLYTLTAATDTEAFGITLEPEGGSESPTLERLYVLGAI